MTDLSLKILCKSINSTPLLIKGTFYEMPFVVCFSIDNTDKKTKIMSWPIGDYFQVLIKTEKQGHGQLTHIKQRVLLIGLTYSGVKY